jgi:predicted phosphate transport protein (TIGR00153 family)
MFKKFLPKEEKYFDHFNDMISHIDEMAGLTCEYFSSDIYDPEVLLKLKPLEKRCDELQSKVVRQLNKSFITPFDREDIFTLVNKLDDISDTLYGASKRIEIFKISRMIRGADKLSLIVKEQIAELNKAIHGLRADREVMDDCKAVKDLEGEADIVYQSVMTQLFEMETDAITLMKEKEILDILEHASDKCQTVATVIVSMVIKNA